MITVYSALFYALLCPSLSLPSCGSGTINCQAKYYETMCARDDVMVNENDDRQ